MYHPVFVFVRCSGDGVITISKPALVCLVSGRTLTSAEQFSNIANKVGLFVCSLFVLCVERLAVEVYFGT